MKSTITRFAAAAILATASTGALAFPVGWQGSFALYDSLNGNLGGSTDVTGFIDTEAGTWSVASATPVYGYLWSASGGTLYGPGTHTVNVNGDGSDVFGSGGNVSFTVGAGQLGGNINVSWNGTSGIDVFQVWDVSTGVETLYTSSDADADGVPGMAVVDGPFVGVSVVYNMSAPVPEASTTAMLLAGLGLVGVAARRRQKA